MCQFPWMERRRVAETICRDVKGSDWQAGFVRDVKRNDWQAGFVKDLKRSDWQVGFVRDKREGNFRAPNSSCSLTHCIHLEFFHFLWKSHAKAAQTRIPAA